MVVGDQQPRCASTAETIGIKMNAYLIVKDPCCSLSLIMLSSALTVPQNVTVHVLGRCVTTIT